MGIFPSDQMLTDLLKACGKQDGDEDSISFDLFARAVALLLEENNMDKGSTSSKDNAGESERDRGNGASGIKNMGEVIGAGQNMDEEEDEGMDPYYNEYDVREDNYY